jgi:hypothetical protein
MASFIAIRDTTAVNTTITIPKGARVEARKDTAMGTLPSGYLVLLEDRGDAYSGLHFALVDFRRAKRSSRKSRRSSSRRGSRRSRR